MTERFLHHIRVERPPTTETAAEARARLGEKFPRAALRRMTHLGMLLGTVLEGLALTPDDALVYATSFAETRALEDFLGSFPAASPLLFQTSIHPGGIQQVLIGRQQPIARLWPLAGRKRLVEQALLTALLESAPRVVLAGGEERGTWLLENHMASDRAFAFGLVVSAQRDGALARVVFDRNTGLEVGQVFDLTRPPTHPAECQVEDLTYPETRATPSLCQFADALAERQPLQWQGAAGAWSLAWS